MSSDAASEGEDWGDVTPILARGLQENRNVLATSRAEQFGCVTESVAVRAVMEIRRRTAFAQWVNAYNDSYENYVQTSKIFSSHGAKGPARKLSWKICIAGHGAKYIQLSKTLNG